MHAKQTVTMFKLLTNSHKYNETRPTKVSTKHDLHWSPNLTPDTLNWLWTQIQHCKIGQIMRRNMTETQAAVVRSKSAAAAARSWRTNNGKRLRSECGRQQRSHPCPLMWPRVVSLEANSLLIYTTATTHNPNTPQTTNYVRLTL